MSKAAKAVQPDEASPIDLGELPGGDLIEWLETMTLIREFEQACDPLAKRGTIPAGIHSSAGQEAVAVGSIRALEPDDIVVGTHRTHHHAIAKGLPPDRLMAELAGRATGCCGGRAGTMHLADHSRGYFGGNGIVGAGVGLAMGAALASHLRGGEQVALGFLGDGGANTGRTWESVNMAAIWKLPLIVLCENNMYAVETSVDRVTAGNSISGRAKGFGLPVVELDGQDVGAVYRATSRAAGRARGGHGPTFIEAKTYRYEGHSTGQIITYRSREELQSWRRRDPILRLKAALEQAQLLKAGDYEELLSEVQAKVARAVEFAEQSPLPNAATAADNVIGAVISEGYR
jgi:TPP-dependent pyruvate/acetoin dehydrogenase alpha subunit